MHPAEGQAVQTRPCEGLANTGKVKRCKSARVKRKIILFRVNWAVIADKELQSHPRLCFAPCFNRRLFALTDVFLFADTCIRAYIVYIFTPRMFSTLMQCHIMCTISFVNIHEINASWSQTQFSFISLVQPSQDAFWRVSKII